MDIFIITIIISSIIFLIIGFLIGGIKNKLSHLFFKRKLKNPRFLYEQLTKNGYTYIDNDPYTDKSYKLDIGLKYNDITGKEELFIKRGKIAERDESGKINYFTEEEYFNKNQTPKKLTPLEEDVKIVKDILKKEKNKEEIKETKPLKKLPSFKKFERRF